MKLLLYQVINLNFIEMALHHKHVLYHSSTCLLRNTSLTVRNKLGYANSIVITVINVRNKTDVQCIVCNHH